MGRTSRGRRAREIEKRKNGRRAVTGWFAVAASLASPAFCSCFFLPASSNKHMRT